MYLLEVLWPPPLTPSPALGCHSPASLLVLASSGLLRLPLTASAPRLFLLLVVLEIEVSGYNCEEEPEGALS